VTAEAALRETGRLILSVKRLTGIRLTVFLPLFLVGVVLAVELWAIRLTVNAVGKSISHLSVAQSQALRETTFLVLGVGGGLALLLGLLLAVAIGRPIKVLLERTERMMPSALPRPAVQKIDELSTLSNSMNTLLLSFEKYLKISNVFDRLPEGILALTQAGEIVSANAEAQRLYAPDQPGLVGRHLPELLERSHEENGLLLDLVRTTVDEVPTTFAHLTLQTRDSRRVEVRGSLAKVQTEGGGTDVILTVQDLAHARAIEGEVRRVDQLAALGALGATIVHDIGGAVQVIQTLVDLIAPQIPPGSDESRYVDKLQVELDRVRRLADEIRTLAQVEIRERVTCQVDALVSEALWAAEARHRNKAIVVANQIQAVPAMLGDPDRLTRAVRNVVVNAFEATPPSGRVMVDVREEKAPVDGVLSPLIAVRIANSGSHIAPADVDRIFELFYTTKTGGSGLGLPVAVRAVADHGGKISVRSSPAEGTEFTLLLPLDGGSRR
jgi:signal transduction histidine kinase